MPDFLLERTKSTISDGMRSISDVIANHLFRLQSFTFRFHEGNFSECLRDSVPKLFPTISTLGETATSMLEELTVVDQGRVSGAENNIFTHPIPSLTRLSWKVSWPVTNVLAPAPLRKLTHLRLLVHRNLPSSEYTSNITHLFLYWSWHDPDYSQYGQNVYFPRLEDLTLYGLNMPCPIKSPHLTTLRLVDAKSCSSILGGSPDSPSLSRLHVWAHVDGLENLEVYINQLPLLTEVAFLHFSKEAINALKDRVGGDKISVKAYLYSPEKDHWTFTSYEHGEITFTN